jgi:hypothetical protein
MLRIASSGTRAPLAPTRPVSLQGPLRGADCSSRRSCGRLEHRTTVFFMWLILHGRCWTFERLQRHGLQNHDPCTLCSQGVGTIDHLFMQCVVSWEIWYKLLHRCGWNLLAPSDADQLIDWWLCSRKLVTNARHKAFDSLVVLITSSLWLERNSRVYMQGCCLDPIAPV